MRTLVLLRGLPGVGKSTWIKAQGLEPYTLSADQIRLLTRPSAVICQWETRNFKQT